MRQRLFPVAAFKCKALQWQDERRKVWRRERERVQSVASALIAFNHTPLALCSRLLPGEVVHHLYAPKDLIRYSPRRADWEALWQACFRAGITRFKQPFCNEHWGVWTLARRTLQQGLAERQFLPDQVAELLAHDPWQAQQAGSGAPQPAKSPEQASMQEVQRHLRSVGLQEAGVPGAIVFAPRPRPGLQRSLAIRRFLETMPPQSRPYLPQKRTAKKDSWSQDEARISPCKTSFRRVFKGIEKELQSQGLPSKKVGLHACTEAVLTKRNPDDGFRMLSEDHPAEAAKATTAPAGWAQVEAERASVQAKQKEALAIGAFQFAVDETAIRTAEIRAMHCNDLDLDLPSSRSETVILRSAKLCEQLSDSNLSHPAVQNPHSTAQVCWLCRELGRAQALQHGLGERCDRVRADRGARAGQAIASNLFHPDHKACKCGGRGGTHKRTAYDDPSRATHWWQYDLNKSLCTKPEVSETEEDDGSADPEWCRALIEARLQQLRGEWTRRVCRRRKCGGRCDRMYRDPWLWIRHREGQESCRMETADYEVGDAESSDAD